MSEADEQAGHEAASTQEAANEVDRDTRDTAAQAILDGDIDQETGEHDDEVLEEIDVDEDDVIESLPVRVVALEGVLRRILAEPQLLACGDKAFCNELAAMLDGAPSQNHAPITLVRE
jgi:hypothetical protein